jgi:hypothetical protein
MKLAGRVISRLLPFISFVALVGSGGCGSTAPVIPKGSGPQVAVIYLSPEKAARTTAGTAAFGGTLHGDVRSGCLWLVRPHGGQVQLKLAGPFTLDWYPSLTVYKNGKTFAREGQTVSLGGGSGASPVPGCPVGGDAVLVASY